VFEVLIQLLNRLEKLHQLGMIHGNVCPSSLRIDLKEDCKVYLCDFYYSRIATSECPPSRRRYLARTKFEGDAFFCSTAACHLKDFDISDDIESTFILASYLLNAATLPWMSPDRERTPLEQDLRVVERRLKTNFYQKLLETLPVEMRSLYQLTVTKPLFETDQARQRMQIA
jgi:serine/threonine protein kinase